jgi:predicted ATPase
MLANRINSITIRNFRSLGDVTVELEDLTVLVGANGTGKSNFLAALGFVRDVVVLGLQEAFSKHLDLLLNRHKNPVSGLEFEVSLVVSGQDVFFSFAFDIDSKYQVILKHEAVEFGDIQYDTNEDFSSILEILGAPPSSNLAITDSRFNTLLLQASAVFPRLRPLLPVREFLANLRIYSIFPDTLRPLTRPGKPDSFLDEDGQNMTTLLQDFVKIADSKRKQDFYEELERIVPGIDVDNPITVTEIGGYLVVTINHSDTRGTLDLGAESDGTLRALALLMALNQTPGPSIIGIEEPELMLHPEAMGVLADVIRGASQRSQVILTTHSPDLITNFPVKSLRIVELENGATIIGPVREDHRQIVEDKLFGSGNLLRLGGLARE